MAIISKPHTFTAGTVISPTQMNANFDKLYLTLSGTDTSTQFNIVSSDGSTPVILNQASANFSQEWQDAGTTKLRVLKNGILESLVPTGNAPFIVESTTRVANLNCDRLDGLNSTDFGRILDGVLEISHDDPVLRFTDTTVDATDFDISTKVIGANDALVVTEKDGPTDVFSIDSTGLVIAANQVRVQSSAPANIADLTRKDYVDNRKVPISIGGFFPGTASTAASRPSFVVPAGVVSLAVRQMVVIYQAGTNTGTTTVGWVLNGTSKDAITLTTSPINTVTNFDIADVTLNAGDRVYFRILAAGDHADITVQLNGDMKVTS